MIDSPGEPTGGMREVSYPVNTSDRRLSQSNDLWNDVRLFLANGSAYGSDRPPGIVETHISILFFLPTRVYKLKKPVDFGFLNYGSEQARKTACTSEVRLNTPMAPGVYLGVRPITMSPQGHLTIDGVGRPVEWIVEMRRLPEDRMLDQLISAGTLTPSECQTLAKTLGAYYSHLPSLGETAPNVLERMDRHILDNFAELTKPAYGLDSVQLRRIQNRQMQFASLNREVFELRIRGGRMVAGHGDLRPEHICMEGRPVVFDCIDFNDEFRELDVADELAFLAMECDALGHSEIGQTVLEEYCRQSDDTVPLDLFNFYKSYRACVRAKVAALRSTQLSDGGPCPAIVSARHYLSLADIDLGFAARPRCIIVRGRSGTGKSAIASELGNILGAPVLQTDAIRRGIFLPGSGSAYGTGTYQQDNRNSVYEQMLRQGREILQNNCSVILDGCFLSRSNQKLAVELAEEMDVPAILISCNCPDDVAAARVASRSTGRDQLSEIRPDHLTAQCMDDEGPLAGAFLIEVNTDNHQTPRQLIFDRILSAVRGA